MTAKVIMNPYSNRWRSLERRDELESALKAAGISYEIVLSERKGQIISLAEDATRQGFSPIIAAGGDGTLGEVANGILRGAPAGKRPPMGLMPMGTANDLVTNLKLPLNLADMAKTIAHGSVRALDVIQVNDYYFINNSGLGLEPTVTTIHERITWIRGVLRYLIAAIWAIMLKPSWEMSLEWEGGDYTGPITLVSIGNCHCTGGVFYTVPHADPFDGRLSFTFAYLPSRIKIFKAMPMIMKPGPGNITEHPAVREIHATWLKVRSKQSTPAHADGELISRAIQEVHYQVIPGGIDVLM